MGQARPRTRAELEAQQAEREARRNRTEAAPGMDDMSVIRDKAWYLANDPAGELEEVELRLDILD